MLPCDPVLPTVGVVRLENGDLRVGTGPTTAATMTALEVRVPSVDGSTPGSVLWRIERDSLEQSRWDGAVVLGQVPPGFHQVSVPEPLPRPGGMVVEVDSPCMFAAARFEDLSTLHEGVVNGDEGQTWDVDSFRGEDVSFGTCAQPSLAAARPYLLGAVLTFVMGGSLIVVALMLRAVRASRRSPA